MLARFVYPHPLFSWVPDQSITDPTEEEQLQQVSNPRPLMAQLTSPQLQQQHAKGHVLQHAKEDDVTIGTRTGG